MATQGVMSIPLICAGKRLMSGKNESLLIEQELRNRGVSAELYKYSLTEYKKEQYCFLWGFSRKALPTLRKADFWVFSKPVSRAILSLSYYKTKDLITANDKPQLKDRLLYAGALLATAYSSAVFKMRSRLTDKNTLYSTNTILDDDDVCGLFQRFQERYPDMIYIEQNEVYYKWRIGKSPLPIHPIFLYDQKVLVGYIYICIRPNGLELIDFAFTTNKVGKVLLLHLYNFIGRTKCGFVTYYGNKHNALNKRAFALLVRFGFIIMPGPNDFVLRLFDEDLGEEVLNITNWYITSLWYEGI